MSNDKIRNVSGRFHLGPLMLSSLQDLLVPVKQSQNCPEMFETLLYISCKDSYSTNSSIISLLNKTKKIVLIFERIE